MSLLVVSSNPGVSIKVTTRPSRLNGCATWTMLVQDLSPLPMCKFDPLARLMNYAVDEHGLVPSLKTLRVLLSFHSQLHPLL